METRPLGKRIIGKVYSWITGCCISITNVFYSRLILSATGLFNLRGSDIIYNPVFMAYAIVTDKNVW
jgi:hypothetical protein